MDNNYQAYEYAELIVKEIRGELTASEEARLNSWIEESPENALLIKKLKDEASLKSGLDLLSNLNTEKAWAKIVLAAHKVPVTTKIYILLSRWGSTAAAILLVGLSLSAFFYKKNQQAIQPQIISKLSSKYGTDLPPGTDKAQLTLANGSVIVIDAHTSGIVKKYNGINISSAHGVVTYQAMTGNNSPVDNLYNTITTPIGSKYKIRLPDGSNVWLNSGSSLKFPMAFTPHHRKVYLSGEAYFEVSKNKHQPFSVFANQTEIRVLGTHFNVHAYSDEKAVKTILLEGAVQVLRNGYSKMILPGQQAQVKDNSSKIEVDKVDINEFVAWKDGMFNFESQPIESVMKEIARWYNVEVEYQDAIPEAHFSGVIARNNNISQILNMLELTGGVHFSIDGRKVIVKK